MKKRHKEIKFNLYVILFILLVSVVIYFTSKPSYTGYSILENSPLIDSLNYNENLIDFSNNEIKLKSSAITENWTTYSQEEINITSAFYDFTNKTLEAFAKDNNRFTPYSSKITNIVFENFLNNNDIITLYLKTQKTTNIYICPPDIECTSSNYGSVYFPNQEGYYNITIQNLNYPVKVFNLNSDETLDIDYITSNQGNIREVWYDYNYDKTSTLSTLDNTVFTTNAVEVLDVIFSEQLQNNDIIQLNLKQKDPTQVILCDASTFCSSNYGALDYNGEEGWYNLTLQNLESPKTTFNLDPDKIKIDFLNALRITSAEHSETNITYPSAAEITTGEISVLRLYSWNYLTVEQILNGQNISYEYSADSGITWNQIENFDLSNVSALSKKIKFKIILQSNQTVTPVISNITLSYFIDEPPVYYDLNATGTISLTVNQETVINESVSNTELTLSPSQNIEDAQINISIINSNISDSTKVKELEILAPDLENKLNNVTLKIFYNENEIENITESSLSLKYFNETSQEWELINSSLNTEENYLESILEHLSVYALFGEQNTTEEPQEPETPSSSSSGSSGGGSEGSSNNRILRNTNNQQPSAPIQSTPSKPQEQTEEQTITAQAESSPVTGNTIVDVGKILTAGKINKSLWSLTLILIGVYVYIRRKEKGRQKFLSLR